MCKFCEDKKQLVETQAQANRQVAKDLAKKIKLEEPFAKDLRRLFNQILDDYQIIYSTTGQVLNMNPYRDDLTAILKNHYRKTNKQFKDNITGDLEQTQEIKELQLTVSTAMANYINTQSVQQAQLINQTTQNDLIEKTRKIITDAAIEGQQLSNAETATLVKREYNAQIPARAELIAYDQTTDIAEEAKQMEATFINASALVIGGITVRGMMEAMWNSVLGKTTRPAHAQADGQRRPVGQPFLVGGELLRRPRDPMGRADNTINCLCNLTYSLRK